MTLPLVTTIIPSFNHGKYIGQAIESVLAQDYPHIQFIIVDDGSSDDSHSVIQSYVEKHPQITAILNTDNRGQSAVFNQALSLAQGEFVQLLPSDDWYAPEKTRLQLEKFLASPPEVGVVYGRGQRFFEDTGEIKLAPAPIHRGKVAEIFITHGQFIYPITPMFRRSIFDKVQLDETLKAEGEAVYIRMAIHCEFDFVDEVVGTMRDHTYNIGKQTDIMYEEVQRYWTAFFQRDDIPDNLRALRKISMRRLHRTKGLQFIGENRNYRMGRIALLRAIRADPMLLIDPKVIGALAITMLPGSLADWVVAKRPEKRHA